MGKKKRVRALAADSAELGIVKGSGKKYSAKKSEGAWKKPVGIICAILAIVLIIGAFAWYYIPTSGIIQKNKVIMKSEHYKITAAMAEYLLNSSYQNYAQSYSSYLSYIGLDVTEDLKTQDFPQADGEINTWYDYFMDSAYSQLEQSVVLCEAAIADEDYEIDYDTINDAVDEAINEMKEYAESNSVTFDYYLSKIYGNDVDENVIKQVLTMSEIATDYSTVLDERNEFGEEDWNNYYEENKDTFLKVDYLKYEFTAETTEVADDATEEEKAAAEIADAAALEAAKAVADEALKLTGEEEFNAYVENYLRTVVYADMTDEELEEDSIDIAQLVADCKTEGTTNSGESELNTFLFNTENKGYETYEEEGDSSYTVYMILPAEGNDTGAACTYRDTYKLRSYSYMKFSVEDSTYADLDTAKGVAEEVYGSFEENPTAENFKTLSEVEGAEYAASDVTSGDYGVVADVVDEWVFDDAREEGDYTILNDDNGYYIIYFVSTDKISWQNTADSSLRSDAYSAKLEELTESVKIDTVATAASVKGLISIVDLSALADSTSTSTEA